MQTIDKYIDVINKAIAAIEYPQTPFGLYEPVKYQLDMGGKRVRPLLAVMACDMFVKYLNMKDVVSINRKKYLYGLLLISLIEIPVSCLTPSINT